MPAVRIPRLEGQRLRLEALAPSHSQGMFELWREARVCEFSGPSFDSRGDPIRLPAASPHDSDRLIAYWLDRAREGTGFRWAVVSAADSEFLGAAGFNLLGECSEYAYHFIPRHWGAGFATEASHLALSWSFDSGAKSVEVFILPANTKSIRLAERLGFKESEEKGAEPSRHVLTRANYPARNTRIALGSFPEDSMDDIPPSLRRAGS